MGKSREGYNKEYQKLNKDRLVEYRKARYELKKEEILKKCKDYRIKNKESISESKKEYYEANKEIISEKIKLYRGANKERLAKIKKEDHLKNRERDLKRSREHYYKNKKAYKVKAKRYQELNKEKLNNDSKKWVLANPGKRLESIKKYNHKIRSTPKGNLSSTISKRMNESLRKGMKAGRHWETLVEYTVDQLKTHIEKQFDGNMTWANYGEYWHIDHVIPVSVFNFKKPEDEDFKRCWCLKNLRPLEKIANMSKGARLIKPFQPSLSF